MADHGAPDWDDGGGAPTAAGPLAIAVSRRDTLTKTPELSFALSSLNSALRYTEATEPAREAPTVA